MFAAWFFENADSLKKYKNASEVMSWCEGQEGRREEEEQWQ